MLQPLFVKYPLFQENYNIIENALKELEFYQKRDKTFKNDVNKLVKKLKALEIIKEKKVDLTNLLFIYEHEPQYGLKVYNNSVNKYRGEKELTQEEYDLLKEVLLWD